MKTRVLIFTAALLFALNSLYAQVSFISGGNGTVTVRTTGSGKGVRVATENAEKNIFYVLLYRGIAGSDQKTPLVDIAEGEAQQKYKNYLDDLFGQRYATFITAVIQNGDVAEGKHHQADISLDVTVNISAFRKDLESNGVIRKFGY